MKTPEEMAEYWMKQAEPCCNECYKDGFLVGYKAGFDAAIITQTKMGGAIDRMIQLARKGLEEK
jgi:hypothetical protein